MKDILIRETESGKVSIQEDAIKSIIETEIINVVGVGVVQKNWITKAFANFKNKTKIKTEEGILVLELPISVFYGTNIVTVSNSVQSKVLYILKEMFGLEKVKIDILVENIIMNEQ